MTLLTEAQTQQLKTNGLPENHDQDHPPVVRLFLPFTGCCWLLSEIGAEDPDMAFGLCDLGMGHPELGNVSLIELQSIVYLPDLGVEQDGHFQAEYPMSVYAAASRSAQAITTDPVALRQAQASLQARRSQRSNLRPS